MVLREPEQNFIIDVELFYIFESRRTLMSLSIKIQTFGQDIKRVNAPVWGPSVPGSTPVQVIENTVQLPEEQIKPYFYLGTISDTTFYRGGVGRRECPLSTEKVWESSPGVSVTMAEPGRRQVPGLGTRVRGGPSSVNKKSDRHKEEEKSQETYVDDGIVTGRPVSTTFPNQWEYSLTPLFNKIEI